MVETIEAIFSARNLFSVIDVELHQRIHADRTRMLQFMLTNMDVSAKLMKFLMIISITTTKNGSDLNSL